MTDVDMTASRRALLAGALGAGGLSMAMGGSAAALPIPADSGSDFFLDVDGIAGESQRADYENLIEPLTWSFGASVDDAGSGRRRGGATLSDFVFVNPLSKASPKLFEALVQGKVIKDVKLYAVRSGGDDNAGGFHYLYIELQNVQLVGYDLAPGEQDGYPIEVVRARYEEITFTYRVQGAHGEFDGEVTTTYKVPRGR